VELNAPHIPASGAFDAMLSLTKGELTGTLTPEQGYPGSLTFEAVGVHVEPPSRVGGLLALGTGPRGLDLEAAAAALGPCDELWEEAGPSGERDNANEMNCTQLVSGAALENVTPTEFAQRLALLAGAMGLLARQHSRAPVFPAFSGPALPWLISSVGLLVERNPSDEAALRAMVRLFNFGLLMSTPCTTDGCPA
jgi:hypothetical protein